MPLIHDGNTLALDIALRLLLFSLYAVFDATPPFIRNIHPEEVWWYQNPVTDSYCPMNILWELVIALPSAAIFVNYILKRDKSDVTQAFLSFSLAIGLNGTLTNLIKVLVGRPRPDYYYRCFPDGKGNNMMLGCTGDLSVINEGLKSFPSGHSSVAFASLGFLSLYMAGKMRLFTPKGKGSTWKLMLFLTPLVVAGCIGISRTCDYHHHWQDVVCGSLLGFGVCCLCYYNYYPSLSSEYCHIPWTVINSRPTPSDLEIKDV